MGEIQKDDGDDIEHSKHGLRAEPSKWPASIFRFARWYANGTLRLVILEPPTAGRRRTARHGHDFRDSYSS